MATKEKRARKRRSKSIVPPALALKIEYVLRGELKAYSANARQHSEAQVAELARSIERFGWAAPILIENDGTVIAGHGRLRAAELLEIERVPVVRLSNLTNEQARALRLADNRLAELATWDDELLAQELRELRHLDVELEGVGWSDGELAKLIGEELLDEQPPAPAADEPEPPPAFVVTQPGDVWILGRHRIVCGDSLKGDASAIALDGSKADMVCTDPPYAIYGSASGVSASVTDDKIVRPFFRAVFELAQRVTAKFAHAYVFCDWRSWASLWEAAKGTRMEAKNMVVWEKNGSGLGSFYANTHELVFFAVHCPPQKTMRSQAGDTGHRSVLQANVMKAQRPRGDDRQHNAAKPLDVLERLIHNSSDEGGLVFDPFGGSGSALIACELANRRCATVEIDAAMVDVTVRRWQKRTGAQATTDKGRPFDELAREREAEKG